MLLGLFVISVISASVGYLIASFSWNWWVRHKRKVAIERMRTERGEG